MLIEPRRGVRHVLQARAAREPETALEGEPCQDVVVVKPRQEELGVDPG